MKDSFVSLLALERCEIHLAQICALAHALPENKQDHNLQDNTKNILHITQSLVRDIALLKETIE